MVCCAVLCRSSVSRIHVCQSQANPVSQSVSQSASQPASHSSHSVNQAVPAKPIIHLLVLYFPISSCVYGEASAHTNSIIPLNTPQLNERTNFWFNHQHVRPNRLKRATLEIAIAPVTNNTDDNETTRDRERIASITNFHSILLYHYRIHCCKVRSFIIFTQYIIIVVVIISSFFIVLF